MTHFLDPFDDLIDQAAVRICEAAYGREGYRCKRDPAIKHACDTMRQKASEIAHVFGLNARQLSRISRGGKISVRGGHE